MALKVRVIEGVERMKSPVDDASESEEMHIVAVASVIGLIVVV